MNIDQNRSTAIQSSSCSSSSKKALKKIDDDFRIQWTSRESEQVRNYKFCSVCGHQLLCFKKRLTAHFEAQHKNLNVKDASFLKCGQTPTECKYSNWAEFQSNPQYIQLQTKKDHVMNSGGRKVNVLPRFAPQKKINLKKNEKCPNQLFNDQKEFSLNPEKFKKQYNYRKKQLVLKEWHLTRERQLIKSIDLAFADQFDKIPKWVFKGIFRQKMAVKDDEINDYIEQILNLNKNVTALEDDLKKKNKEINSIKQSLNQQKQTNKILKDENSNLNVSVTKLEEKFQFLNADEKKVIENYENIKVQLELSLKSSYEKQLQEAKYDLETYQKVVQEQTEQNKRLISDYGNANFAKNQAILKQEELQKSLDFYKKDCVLNQTRNDDRAEELKIVYKEFEEFILLQRDSDEYLKNKRCLEIEENFYKGSMMKSITQEVAKKRKETEKKINDLKKQIEDLKVQNYKVYNEMLSKYHEKICQYLNDQVDHEETLQYNTRTVRILDELRSFISKEYEYSKIVPTFSSNIIDEPFKCETLKCENPISYVVDSMLID